MKDNPHPVDLVQTSKKIIMAAFFLPTYHAWLITAVEHLPVAEDRRIFKPDDNLRKVPARLFKRLPINALLGICKPPVNAGALVAELL